MTRAVFFDKDGTLIPDIPYNTDVSLITFSKGAEKAIHLLSDFHYLYFIISNQSGIARGFMSEEDVEHIKNKLISMFDELDARLTGFYYCPHDSEGVVQPYSVHCDCRKPQPGMLLRAAREYSIDLSNSWFIGDILDDIEAGNRAGCKTILVDNGNETEWLTNKLRNPGYRVNDLEEAAKIIANHSK